MKNSSVNIQDIVRGGLCVGCGFCASVCPSGAIKMIWSAEKYWEPEITAEKCLWCGLCEKVCPNSPEKLSKYAEKAFQDKENFGLNNNARWFSGYDLNSDNRKKSASGGVLTSVLRAMLEGKEVDGIITSSFSPASIGGPHYKMEIVRSVDVLERTRSSHYYPACYENVLEEISKEAGIFALVGVPCVIRAVRSLPPSLSSRIRYTFALVCSHNVTGRFTDCLARQEGIRVGEVFTVDLRDKYGQIKNANHYNTYFSSETRKIRINRFRSAFTAMWRNYFFAQEGCLYCPDFYGTDADMSVKDAWGRLSSDPLGISMVISRNPEITRVLEKLKDDGKLYLENCGKGEIKRSQPQTPFFKHVAVINRMRWKSMIKKTLPESVLKERILKKNMIKDSIEYFYFHSMIKLSGFLYPLMTRLLAKGTGNICSFCIKALIYFLKVCGTGIKILQGLVSPISYVISGRMRYPRIRVDLINNKSERPFKVLLMGGYGYKNVGDEAQLDRVIQNWKKSLPAADIKVLSPDPDYTRKEHGEKTELAPRAVLFEARKNGNYARSNILFKWRYLWINPRMIRFARNIKEGKTIIGAYPEEIRLLKSVAESDVVHFSGGGYLTGMTLSRLWDGMLMMRIARILDTPVILSGQTIGVFKDKRSRKLAKLGLSAAELISLRDPEDSRKDLEEIGIEPTKISIAFDDALFCNAAEKKDVLEILAENGVSRDAPYVVVNVHYFKQRKSFSKKCMIRIADICDKIASGRGAKVVFLPMAPSDVKAIEDVRGRMKERSYIIEYGFNYRIARGIIENSVFMLTMKHHGIIFAIGAGVPVIAVALDDYYVRKNFGALKLFGQEEFLARLDDLFVRGIMEKKIETIFKERDKIRARINENREIMRSADGEVIVKFLDRQKS